MTADQSVALSLTLLPAMLMRTSSEAYGDHRTCVTRVTAASIGIELHTKQNGVDQHVVSESDKAADFAECQVNLFHRADAPPSQLKNFERPASIPMMSGGEQKLLLSIVDCGRGRHPQEKSNDIMPLSVLI